ncbi:MAG: sulfatase-like hydrolase/transferase [Bradymonadaceae bacterium]
MEKIRRALDRHEWAFLFGAVGPVVSWLIASKVGRVAAMESAGPTAMFGLFASELGVALGLTAGGIALVRAAGTIGRLVLQLLCGTFVAVNAACHHYWVTTGSPLPWSLVTFVAGRYREYLPIIESEVTLFNLAVGGVLVAVVAALPWVLQWWASETETPRKSDGWTTVVAGLLAVASFGVAAAPVSFLAADAEAVREPTIRLLTSALVERAGSAPDRGPTADPGVDLAPALSARLKPDGRADSSGKRKNLVLVVLESVRASSTTIHRPELGTTPFLANLAERSTVMRRAHTTVPHTSQALMSMHCGFPPRVTTMAPVAAVPGALPARCLPELLAEQGYETVFFQSAEESFEKWPRMIDNFGYDHFYGKSSYDGEGFQLTNYFGYEEAVMLGPSRRWLERHADESPFMATYLTLSPHHDYHPPDRYGHQTFSEREKFNRYLNAVYYVDQFVKRLVDQYRRLGLYDETVFVFVADHGEAFGEHGRWQHDAVIYREGEWIPWMIHDGSNPERRTVERHVNHYDLLPTVADLLGYRIVGGKYPGESVYASGDDEPLFLNCYYLDLCIGVIDPPFKFIHHYGLQADELFNIEEDPDETVNVAEEHPSVVRQLRRKALGWRAEVESLYREVSSSRVESRVSRSRPALEHEGRVPLGKNLEIVGYEVASGALEPGGRAMLKVAFHARSDVPKGRRIGYTLRWGGSAEPLKHAPLEGLYPVTQWKKGEYVTDEVTVRVPEKAAGYRVRLLVSLVRSGVDLPGRKATPDDKKSFRLLGNVELLERQFGE